MAQAALPHCHRGQASGGYQRRRPEETVLYRAVQAHWPEFRERAEEQGGLPKFVVKEFEEYLRCGLLEHGCLRLACCRCGFERLVGLAWVSYCCPFVLGVGCS